MKLYQMFIVLFLLSSLHSYEVEGIRQGRFALSASNDQEIIKISSMKGSNQDNEMLAKTEEVPSGTTLEKRRLSSRVVTKNSCHDHWLPKIHEDYYGPRHHLPRHH